jgi:hypothetical protein
MEVVLYATLTCRIILNIREVSNQSVHSELHTTFYESPQSAIRFMPFNLQHPSDPPTSSGSDEYQLDWGPQQIQPHTRNFTNEVCPELIDISSIIRLIANGEQVECLVVSYRKGMRIEY